MGSRTALLPGRIFDVPGLLAKRSALSDSGNMVPDVSLFWRLYVHGLLEPVSCSIPAMLWPGVAVPPSFVCQPHPSYPFLHNVADPECLGRRVETGQSCCWQFCRALPRLPRFVDQGPVMSCWYGPNGLLCFFSYIYPVVYFFLKSHKFQHPLPNTDVSLYVSTCHGVSGQNLKPFCLFFCEVMVLE